jgi:hypothetical protein
MGFLINVSSQWDILWIVSRGLSPPASLLRKIAAVSPLANRSEKNTYHNHKKICRIRANQKNYKNFCSIAANWIEKNVSHQPIGFKQISAVPPPANRIQKNVCSIATKKAGWDMWLYKPPSLPPSANISHCKHETNWPTPPLPPPPPGKDWNHGRMNYKDTEPYMSAFL